MSLVFAFLISALDRHPVFLPEVALLNLIVRLYVLD